MASALLWPDAQIVAIDNDATAMEVCAANVYKNGLQQRIKLETRSINEDDDRHFDLVLANLSFSVLEQAEARLQGALSAQGYIALSGLLADQARQIASQYCASLALEGQYSEEEEGWRALLLRVRPQ